MTSTGYAEKSVNGAQFVSPLPRHPEIKGQWEAMAASIEDLKSAIAVLEEKVGYIAYPKDDIAKVLTNTCPMPTRSPLAHNLSCHNMDLCEQTQKIREIIASLEI